MEDPPDQLEAGPSKGHPAQPLSQLHPHSLIDRNRIVVEDCIYSGTIDIMV